MPTTKRPAVGEFVGQLGSDTYTDRAAFERDLRIFTGAGKGRTSFRPGDDIILDVDGGNVRGQVWERAPQAGAYWVRGEDGHTYRVGPRSLGRRSVTRVSSHGTPTAEGKTA